VSSSIYSLVLQTYSCPRTANAILAYGASWAYYPSTYGATLDGGARTAYSANSSLPDLYPSPIFTSGLLTFQPNPSGSLRALTIDNADGQGYLGIDYFEIISVSGGTPCAQFIFLPLTP
jgi:hypothetical protein